MTTPLQHTSLGELGYSPLGATSLGELGELVIELPDADVHPPGMGRRQQIIREDEEIMAIIVAFLTMKGQ
jgi:hypothetical protein